ncbi:FAD-dependent oxidoreductase [Novosphingobium sp. PY1]|uniref:oxidoreductase n=1 Tax=Novosphingobium sp. PY1 TaxID=1882221 RepID=UPI001A8E3619|nr:FAD-dependent oxidoreductase [Novosphingobium sp. PY1]GFM30631.1 NADH-dependent oxidoreductase [Novosphingobium sp. PY1]
MGNIFDALHVSACQQRTMDTFPRLFSPLQIGTLALENRIVMLPHGTSMLADGMLTEGDIAYYERRARTRPGLMITGASVVSPDTARRGRKLLENYSDHALEGLAKRVEAVHQHGVPIVGQIIHLGRESIGAESDYPLLAPSPLRSPRDLFAPQEMDDAQIREVIEAFALSAANLEKTGHDGVEIHGAHGYLVAQFLSPATNHRSDRWGGTPERRMRFLREIIETIRGTCGASFLLGLRLSADEEIADGLEIADTRRIVEVIARDCPPDYVSVTLGTRGAYVKDVTQPAAMAARAAGILREASGLVTIAGQRMTSPEVAEHVLEAGQADAIGFARAFVADADWVAKAASGEAGRIRPCIGLNQDCRAFAPHLHCAVNPATGRELESPFAQVPSPTDVPRRIAVVGGGPAGMEAARVAALRGHDVTLHEASDGLGGQFLLASSVPERAGLRRLLDYLQGELRLLGVDVRLGSRISGADDLSGSYDAVIVATGAEPNPIDAERFGPGAMRWFEVLTEGAPAPRGNNKVLMVDDGSGFWWTYGVANALVDAGWQLTLATPSATIAAAIPTESVAPLLGRLGGGQARYLPLTEVLGADEEGVDLVNLASGEVIRETFDLLVVQTGRSPVSELRKSLAAVTKEMRSVGDCLAPRRVSHAIFEAFRAAATI